MKRFYSPGLLLPLILSSSLFFGACNIKGFFVKSGDAPEWVDPQPVPTAGATASGAAGGPGADVYKRICNTCHGANGKGTQGVYPPLAGSAILQGDPSKPIKIVLHGFTGKIDRGGQTYNGIMAPWKDALSDGDIADALTFARASFGNTAGPVSADEVKAVRDATASHAAPMTESEL